MQGLIHKSVSSQIVKTHHVQTDEQNVAGLCGTNGSQVWQVSAFLLVPTYSRLFVQQNYYIERLMACINH